VRSALCWDWNVAPAMRDHGHGVSVVKWLGQVNPRLTIAAGMRTREFARRELESAKRN
jgi:hypothetical protein